LLQARCVDVTPPEIKCPANVTLDALKSESFSTYSWTTPEASDNSGITTDLISVPAVPTTTTTTNGTREGGVESRSEMRFRLGTSTVTYKAQDRRGNMAECSFHVTVIDREPPTVDQCESPPTFLLRGDALIEWDEPVFSDNSGVAPRVERSHENPSRLALGDTIVTYTAYDEAGNNNTCIITIRVQVVTLVYFATSRFALDAVVMGIKLNYCTYQLCCFVSILKEHACHLPVDPIHGQANCTNKAEAIFCSLTCNDGFA
jgi:CUB/sushi domain-containing protein